MNVRKPVEDATSEDNRVRRCGEAVLLWCLLWLLWNGYCTVVWHGFDLVFYGFVSFGGSRQFTVELPWGKSLGR